MRSTKLLFFLAVWKRPEITEICFMGLERLRKLGRFQMEVLAVISEEEMIPLCEKYGVEYVMHENLPLGRKKNFGLTQALKKDFDYLVELGSDDLLKNELFDAYEPHFIDRKPLLGIRSFVFLNSEDGECRLYTRKLSTFGLGRAIRKDILERFKALWPDKNNSGLDNASHFFLARQGVLDTRVGIDKPLAIDIKSQINIWAFNRLEGTKFSLEETLEGLSDQEINAIQCLREKELERMTKG